MEIVLDGQKGWGTGTAGKTLGAILRTIKTELRGRSIVGVVLDGEILTPQRQAELAFRGTSSFSLLEVRTVDSRECARETLEGIELHIASIEKRHAEAMRLIESGEFSRVHERIAECAAAWDTLGRAVRDVATMAGTPLREIHVHERGADEWVKDLGRVLARLQGAIELRDVVRMADIAQHDLQMALPIWKSIAEALKRKLT